MTIYENKKINGGNTMKKQRHEIGTMQERKLKMITYIIIIALIKLMKKA